MLAGETLENLCGTLESFGIPRSSIRSAALIVTDLAIAAGREPSYYWIRVPDPHFYLPWGKSTGKGY